MKLSIGCSDFKKLVAEQYYLVDKTLLIAEILDDAEVVLFTRPRRFGKTLNLSMLHHFFDFTAQTLQEDLFKGLAIARQKELCSKHQNQYLIISLTFKEVKEFSFEAAYEKILQIIAKTYDRFSKVLLNSEKLTEFQKDNISKILKKQASQAEIEDAIYMLSQALHDHYDKKVIILIDEYDTAIQSGYLHDYYDRVVCFFRNLLSAALKDNPYLFKAVLTGILRISRESLFSGLNHLAVYSVMHHRYGPYFGFTVEEVGDMLACAGLQQKADAIKDWYNGYQIGNCVIYNPWSVLTVIQEQGMLNPYWVNTSDNVLVKSLLVNSSDKFKEDFEYLLQGNVVERLIDEDIVFPDLVNRNGTTVWSLLLMAGYLKIVSSRNTDQGTFCKLAIPNREIRNLYRIIIEQWLSSDFGIEWYNQFLTHLLDGEMTAFQQDLQHILEQTISFHDLAKTPEAFYHGFILGITASLSGSSSYETRSNRESGSGRYDYAIISNLADKPSIIFEFKALKSNEKPGVINKAAREALQQIDRNDYLAEMHQRGITKILKIGLAFSGKQFVMLHQND